MTEANAKKVWAQYNLLAERVRANRAKLKTATIQESRAIIHENHELMKEMDRITRFAC